MTELIEKTGSVPVGDKYRKAVMDDGTTVCVGDIVSWDVRDLNPYLSDEDNEAKSMEVITGIVSDIYDTDYGVEIDIEKSPFGRIDIGDIDTNPDRMNIFLSQFGIRIDENDLNGCVVETWWFVTSRADDDYQLDDEYEIDVRVE